MTPPRVSIVTTVYDRLECLDRCLRAMRHSQYQAFEQIVVSDHPSPMMVTGIRALVAHAGERVTHVDLAQRANDWGKTPAFEGLRRAVGEYVCFLSDDNAYLPDHFAPLVHLLDSDPGLGFVYSSCRYAGRLELRNAPPRGAGIDLGQPLFRTAVLRAAFPQGLPFREFAWDWRMISGLLDQGVRWAHHDATTFIFRLAAYPKLMGALA